MARIGTRLTALALAAISVSMIVVPSAASAHTTSYVVQPGDALSVIARRHGLSTGELASANGITNIHLIRVGQRLVIPDAGPTEYTVRGGDTVSGIARRFGVSGADIVALNGLANPDRIRIGQRLALPAGANESSTLALLAARYPSLPTSIASRPERLRLVPSFERWAAHYGVAPDLLMAMAYQESGWQASVVSDKGAIGVGQLMPLTAEWVARDLIGIPTLDPYVPDDNIRMSARFLVWLLGYQGSEGLAVAGYYQGPRSVATIGPLRQTELYVASVSAARTRFQRS
jgi:LysM repeat protein